MDLLRSIVVAQLNAMAGDISGNIGRVRAARAQGAAMGAPLVVCPELMVCGYPAEDLILRPAFRTACMQAVQQLAAETADGGPAIILGSVWEQEGVITNAALLLEAGAVRHIQPKRVLPNYGVFDEKRVFTPGIVSHAVRFRNITLGLLVCEDMWTPAAAHDLSRAGAELLIVINASPFERGKHAARMQAAASTAREAGAPLLYVNLAGAQDDIVFDGASFALDAQGVLLHQWPYFEEVVAQAPTQVPSPLSEDEAVWRAITLALRDYVGKNRFPGVLLGLSGGIDSAVTAAVAADALGAERVLGVLLPSPHTSPESVRDAQMLARSLGIETVTVPIGEAMQAYARTLDPAMRKVAPQREDWEQSLEVGGNLQSRIRGTMLMGLSNATGRMLLSTSNKSEVATGYTTLYGDSCGGYAVLKDIYKTEVYALARWRNAQAAVIPEHSITRAPTAELAPGQKDEDQLPPYPVLDAILKRLIEDMEPMSAIVEAGYARETVEKVARLVRLSEYKRRQMPPGAKVSPMLFGRDWRYPLTNGYGGE